MKDDPKAKSQVQVERQQKIKNLPFLFCVTPGSYRFFQLAKSNTRPAGNGSFSDDSLGGQALGSRPERERDQILEGIKWEVLTKNSKALLFISHVVLQHLKFFG